MNWMVLSLLRAYKWLISPLLPPACRYVPSCSEYAMEAVAHYGIAKGGLKAAWRLARCHPFAHGGFDPVVSCQSPVASGNRVASTEYRVPSVESPDLQLATGNCQPATGDWRLETPAKGLTR